MALSSILTQKRYFDTFSTKKLLKWLLIVIFLISFIFLPKISLGATIFEDDFNSYNAGSLTGQGGWQNNITGVCDPCPSPIITDILTFEGAKSIRSRGWLYPASTGSVKIGQELIAGTLVFYYYPPDTFDETSIVAITSHGMRACKITFEKNTQLAKFECHYSYSQLLPETLGTYELQTWNLAQFEWAVIEFPTNTKIYVRAKLNNNAWSDYHYSGTLSQYFGYDRIYIYIAETSINYSYFDFISENPYAPPIICDDYIDKISCENVGCFWWENLSACLPVALIENTYIYPEIPNPDETIEIYGVNDDLILKGKIEIGFDDAQIWVYEKFYAIFTNLTTGNSFTFEKELDVLPNDIVNYDENLGKISEILPYYLLGNFEINYKLFGRKITNPFETKEIWVEGGVIAISEIIVPPETELPIFEPDSCEGLGTIETWLCEIKNTFKSMFFPSPEKITQLKNTIELIKNKAPFSYLSATKNLLINVKNEVGTSEVNFKVLGQAGILSFAGLDFDVENGSGTENFISFIRKFFTFILLFGLIIWSISFIRKIFK